jgi:hypothetical protein
VEVHHGDLRRSNTKERDRASPYELYLQHGATHGNDLDDWLVAEREVLSRQEPPAEFVSEGRPAMRSRAAIASDRGNRS